MTNEVTVRGRFEDGIAGPLGKLRQRFDEIGGPGASATLFGVAGAKAIGAGFNLIGEAADKAVEFVGDVISEGIKGEESMARLTTSLKDNARGWDGNVASIEDAIHANLRLGFSDDEQRDSLARLVASTHDVTEARRVMSVAMDLARFKGISLSEATDALTKVEGGSYRMLKTLGIQLEKGASQTEALAAVERVANGQAEAYAETTGGKLARAQATINDAMEKAGEALLPALGDALEGVTVVASAVGDGIGAITGVLGQLGDAVANVIHPTVKLTDEEVKAALAFDRVGESSVHALKVDVPEATAVATSAVSKGVDAVIAKLRGEIQAYDDLKRANADVKKKLPDLERALAKAHGAEARRIREEILLTEALAAKAYNAWLKLQKLGHTLVEHGRAEGGPVLAGQTYRVGERGPETLVMGGNDGWIIPNGGSGAGGGGGRGGGAPVVVQARIRDRVLFELIDEHLYWDVRSSSTGSAAT